MSSREKTVSFRAPEAKVNALDALASAKDRPRSYLINEAISDYIELHAYQDSLVLEGLKAAAEGRVVSHEKAVRRFERKFRKRK